MTAAHMTTTHSIKCRYIADLGRLTPLRIPLPDQPFVSCHDNVAYACQHQLISRAVTSFDPTEHISVDPSNRPSIDNATHAKYRWWVGHHAAFCLWRLLAETLIQIVRAGHDSVDTGPAIAMYNAYSVLFLYAGSCSSQTYAEHIRPAMMATHPAFSGRWARDYELIPELLRAAKAAHPEGVFSDLLRASSINMHVHMGLAQHLVPDGRSLLQQAGLRSESISDADRECFDRFFLVERAQICRKTFIAQFVARLTKIVDDLSRTPLDHLPVPDAVRGTRYQHDVRRLQASADYILRSLIGSLHVGKPTIRELSAIGDRR
jgi:hypothetical protein